MSIKKILGEVLFLLGSQMVRVGLEMGAAGGGATLIRSKRYIADEAKARELMAESFAKSFAGVLKQAARDCTCDRCQQQRKQSVAQAN